MSVNDTVQPLSIQQLSFARLASYLSITTEKIQTEKLRDLIAKVIAVYNAEKNKAEKYQSIDFSLESKFKVKLFAKIKKGKTLLTRRLQKEGQAGELPINAGSELLFFFFRKQPRREVFAITTGTAWNVVRPVINYSFPLKSVIRMLDPTRITEVARRCLAGPDTYERLTNPAGHLFYKREALYHLVESFICNLKPSSSLMGLDLFKAPPSIKVETGLLRILHKIPLEAYPKILELFSQHISGEKTYSKDGSQEIEDPLFEFLRFLQPVQGNTEKLNQQLVEKIFHAHQNERPQTVHVRHKYFTDFVYAESYEFQLEPNRTYQPLDRCPTLEDLLELIFRKNLAVFKDREAFFSALKGCSLRYDKKTKVPLLSCLEGEIIASNGNTYFKARNMWYKLVADHHGLLQEDFRSLLRECLAQPGTHPLTHTWSGSARQGQITEAVVKQALGITKGIRTIMKPLKDEKVSYLTKTTVNQKKLMGEILKNPTIKKHRVLIEEKLLSASQLPDEETLKKLLKDDYDEVLKELREPRAILDEKGFVINPFAYPLKPLERLRTGYIRLEELLKQKYLDSQQVQSEEDYNRSYMYTHTNQENPGQPFGPEKGNLVIDQVCPEGVEAGDVIFYDEHQTQIAHIKETLGQTTRDVCSQILNAAHKISSALRLHQPQSYLQLLWEKATQVTDPSEFRGQVQKQFLHLGEENFYRIFRKREITFVYGVLKNRQSLQKEKATKSCLTAQDLKVPELNQEQVFQALKKAQFLDSMGRLTGKFYASSQARFKLEGFANQSKQIYDALSNYASVSDSTIAKFELLRTAEELRKLGFKFKIVEIEKNNLEDPASQSQQASASQTPSSASQVPATPSETPSFEIPDFDDPATDPSQQKLTKIENGPVGFVNIGNSCYINATLQVLFNIPELRDLIETNKAKNALLKEMHALMCVTSGATDTESTLRRLRSELFKLRGKGVLPGSETDQQDAHEFLQLVLEQLDWTPFGLYTSLKVNHPKRFKRKVTPSNHLQIPLQGVNTLRAAVDHYFAEEKMIADGQKVDPLKLTIDGKIIAFDDWCESPKMEGTPDHLILQLVRFNNKGAKITQSLEFPDNGVVTIPHGNNSIEYEIVGLINHLGVSAKAGHYTADLKNYRDPQGNKRSVHCDDEALSLDQPKNPGKDAYLIVLKKKN